MVTIYKHRYDGFKNKITIEKIKMEELKSLYRNKEKDIKIRKNELDRAYSSLYRCLDMYSLNKNIDLFKEQIKKYEERQIKYYQRDIEYYKKKIRDIEKTIKKLDSVEGE